MEYTNFCERDAVEAEVRGIRSGYSIPRHRLWGPEVTTLLKAGEAVVVAGAELAEQENIFKKFAV